MANDGEGPTGADVLRNKREATRYQILVQIAERQPAVSQREVADAIGVTSQAVSDYLQGLVKEGYVEKLGRGRYEVTKEGVDWLISETEELRSFLDHVTEDIVGQVEIETAIATTDIAEGETVSLSMGDGTLRAMAGAAGSTTAIAVTAAAPGQDVGVTNFEGMLEYELGTVTAVPVPRVQDGGSSAVDTETVVTLAADHDLLAVAGTEALAAADAADLTPDLRFGTPEAVREAAAKGLDVLLLAASPQLSQHTDLLREQSLSHEVVEAAREEQ